MHKIILSASLYVLSAILFSSNSQAACLSQINNLRGPARASGTCAAGDLAIDYYLDGARRAYLAPVGGNPPTYTSDIDNLPHGTHTCEVRCTAPGGTVYSLETGSMFIDRSSTSTMQVTAPGGCGVVNVTGAATFSDSLVQSIKGSIKLYSNGNLYNTISCTTNPCSYAFNNIDPAQTNTFLLKTISYAGFYEDTSTVVHNADWHVEFDTQTPIGPSSKCEKVRATLKFCPTQSAAKGYVYVYFDNPSNPYYYRIAPCYTETCTVDVALPTLTGGKHTLIVRGLSPNGPSYYDNRDFYLDEIPYNFTEPDATSEDSCESHTSGAKSIAVCLFEGICLNYNSQDQFATRSGTCPGATYKYQLSQGWTHSLGRGLFKNPNGNIVYKGGGISPKMYTVSGSTYVTPPDDSSTLVKNANGTYKITYRDGTVENFNTAGTLTSTVDRFSNTTTISGIASHVQTVTEPTGKTTTFTYDSTDEKITAITDSNGNTYDFQYDATRGLLTKIINPAPATGQPRPEWNFVYDTSNLISQATDPEGNVTAYGYDANNKISSITDAESFAKTFLYGTGVTTVTDKNSGVWTFDYNTTSRLITAKTDPLGNKTTFTYGTNNKVATESRPVEKPTALTETRYVTAYQYDSYKNVTDEQGYATYITYDSNGNVVSQTNDPVSYHMGYTYDAVNYDQIATATDYMDSPVTTTSYVYDTNGGYQRTTITDPEGFVTVLRKNADGTVHDVTYGNGTVQTYVYNTDKTLQSITGADGVKLEVATYDANKNPKEVKTYDRNNLLKKTTNIDYDNLNRTTQSSVPGSQFNYTNQAGYNKKNDTILAIDAEGNPTGFTYNFRGQATTFTDALGKVTSMEYGANNCPTCGGVDKLTKLTDANGNQSKWEYDAAGRLSKETDSLNNAIRYEYYPSGLVWKKIKDTGGDILATYSYDALGKMTGVSYLDGGWESYTYYPNGMMLTAANQNISYTFEWYKNGWLKKVTDSNGRTVDYNLYDGIGQRRTVTLLAGTADQKVLTYVYGNSGSSNGKLVSIAETGVGTFGLGYDDMGRRSSLSYPNGIVGTYSYHAEQPGWLAGISYQGVLPITAVSYPSFDRTGNRTSKDVDGSLFSYGYDLVYRLLNVTGAGTESFTYDDSGNRLTEAGQMYTVAAGNSLTAKPGRMFTYDYFGNRTGDGEWTYSWNSKGELTQMTKTGTTVTFAYDPFGRRVSKTAVIGGTTTSHVYVYDAEDIALEYVGGVLTSHFVHGPGIDEPLALVRSGGTGSGNYFYHADGLGSVVKITDVAQNMVESYGYDSFGRVTAVGTLDQPYGYTGREYDAETGKLYYRLRYYDADSGRFLSRDPLSFAAGDVVLTNYVGGNPINYVDPWGLIEEEYDTYTKSGGSAAWRNNNPGNMQYAFYAKRNGACSISSFCRKTKSCSWAKFPTEEMGRVALVDLLKDKYGKMTIKEMLPIYAPPKSNNLPAYFAFLKKNGINLDDTVINQLDLLSKKMPIHEGWKRGKIVPKNE